MATWRVPKLIVAFGYAFQGIFHLFRSQRNARIHMLVALNAIALGLVLQIERLDWLAITITIMIVLAMEGVNTAIEAVVDLASPNHHPLAKIAKDVGAGTVLLVAIGSIVVGMLVFLPRLWALIAAWL